MIDWNIINPLWDGRVFHFLEKFGTVVANHKYKGEYWGVLRELCIDTWIRFVMFSFFFFGVRVVMVEIGGGGRYFFTISIDYNSMFDSKQWEWIKWC